VSGTLRGRSWRLLGIAWPSAAGESPEWPRWPVQFAGLVGRLPGVRLPSELATATDQPDDGPAAFRELRDSATDEPARGRQLTAPAGTAAASGRAPPDGVDVIDLSRAVNAPAQLAAARNFRGPAAVPG
jgi:hypothetical protein